MKNNETSTEYEVQAILNRRFTKNDNIQYFVKWVGWAHEHNTWQPLENLLGSPETEAMVQKFNDLEDKKRKWASNKEDENNQVDKLTLMNSLNRKFTTVNEDEEYPFM